MTLEALITAIERKDEKGVLDLIDGMRTEELLEVNPEGRTALHIMAEELPSVAPASVLLKRTGGLPYADRLDSQGRSALFCALEKAHDESEPFVTLLIESSSAETIARKAKNGWTPLALACDRQTEEIACKIVEKLPREALHTVLVPKPYKYYGCSIRAGGGVSRGEPLSGGNALHFAVRDGKNRVAEKLLDHFTLKEMEAGDRTDRPPELLAAILGHSDTVRLLWEKAPLPPDYWLRTLTYEPFKENPLRQFMTSAPALIARELFDRLLPSATDGLLREMLYSAVIRRWEPLVCLTVVHMSQDAIDAPLPDGSTAAECCNRVNPGFLPLLRKPGPKSAAQQ